MTDSITQQLWLEYGVCEPKVVAKTYRNPFSQVLITYATQRAREFIDIVSITGVQSVIGGSLGSDTAIASNNDIDLRLLLPDGFSDELQLKRASALLAREIPFRRVIHEREGETVIYHHGDWVKVSGVTEAVELTLNLQPACSYFGLASKAMRLPEIVRDRYLAAKGAAFSKNSSDDYAAIKRHWIEMILVLNESVCFEQDDRTLAERLTALESRFPLFLRSGRRYD